MRRFVLAALTVASVSVGVAATSFAASTPPLHKVGPDQFFSGAVNGVSQEAVIKVICPGPATAAQTGHPLAGQSVDANLLLPPLVSTLGFTGTAKSIGVELTYPLPPTGLAFAAKLGTLNFYGQSLAIPTKLNVPCSGTGSIAFDPTKGGPDARPSIVAVTFGNVAVTPSS